MSTVHFKVNPTLKSIIGKDLIHSDHIAVIELIKNSKDADATYVQIYFEDEQNLTQESTIYMFDDGHGMTENDLEEKWLYIAYSEKKNVASKRYAGNKGVGRFSCDRLGKKLDLYTKVEGQKKILHLEVDWKLFEKMTADHVISDIDLEIKEITPQQLEDSTGIEDFEHGTALVITELREVWSTKKLLRLFSELEKFYIKTEKKFDVTINTDNPDPRIRAKQGKPIESTVLEKISFKTSYIKSNIDSEGESITATIYYQGYEVLNYTVANPYANLKNISTEIHYIDPLSRASITRAIGTRLVDYGSIFLFYNGFRISPYGNVGDDWLGLDRRKNQGRARFFGTRELHGQINIEDNDDSFSIQTNREGLAYSTSFHELIDSSRSVQLYGDGMDGTLDLGYITNLIRQLESFIVDILGWNRILDLRPDKNTKEVNIISELDIFKDPTRYQLNSIKSDDIDLIKSRILKSQWNIHNININKDIISKLGTLAEEKYKSFLYEFIDKIQDREYAKKLVEEYTSSNLYLDAASEEKIKKVEKELRLVKRKLEDTTAELEIKEKEIEQKNVQIKKQEKITEQRESENIFLRATSNKDSDSLLNLMHKIIDDVLILGKNIAYYTKKRNKGISLTDEMVDELLHVAGLKSRSILKVAQFATLQNYKVATGLADTDIVEFINNYLNLLNNENIFSNKIKLNFTNVQKCVCVKKIRPLNISIMVDNIINNALKAKASSLDVVVTCNEKLLSFKFIDDGIGLTHDAEIKRVFDKGYTFTNGSGLGLYFVKDVVEKELSGYVSAENISKGFIVEVKVPCI